MPTRLLLALVVLLSTAAYAHPRHHGFSVNVQDENVTACDQIDISADDGVLARGEENLTIARAQVHTLRIRGAENGPVSVRGWDRDEYAVKACKAAVGNDQQAAQRRLDQIKLSLQGEQVSVGKPDTDRDWTVYLIVLAPKNADMNLAVKNGPLSLRQISGTVAAEATNGPVALKHCTGNINVRAENGPISISDTSGSVKIDARNGPLALDLNGAQWEGAGLDAHAENGPLSVKLPASYRSGVRVEMSGHSPVRCDSTACESARKNWDGDMRSIEFGSGTPVVRVSTVNGPVEIGSRTAEF